MFRREHHVRIATILQALHAELLAKHKCYFGGGTAIVLLCDEYRESLDIDFLVSDKSGYQALRQLLTTPSGIQAIARPGMEITQAQEIRADRDGIRTFLKVLNTEVKFEIVLEARIELDAPSESDRVCGVSTLTPLDMAAGKLLANSDRWGDDAVFSRDLIDLAMLNLPKPHLRKAIEKAKSAYGDSIEEDLQKAIATLQSRKGWLEECMSTLQMDETPKAVLWKHIRALKLTK